MSVWRIGAESAARGVLAAQGAPPSSDADNQASGFKAAIDNLTKWIPGDALALYVASVTILSAHHDAKPSVALLIAFVVVTPLIAVGSAFAAEGRVPLSTALPTGLAAGAFVIWTLTVPFSGWQRWSLVHNHPDSFAIGAGVAGLLFGLLAEGLSKRAQAT